MYGFVSARGYCNGSCAGEKGCCYFVKELDPRGKMEALVRTTGTLPCGLIIVKKKPLLRRLGAMTKGGIRFINFGR